MIEIHKDFISIHNFPMPPTVNKSYASAIVKTAPKNDWASYMKNQGKPGRGGFVQRRFASKDLKNFKELVYSWALEPKLAGTLATARKLLALHIARGDVLEVQRYFFFHQSSIITKKNEPKVNDVSNRIKALDDAVVELILIDDKYIFTGSETKLVTPDDQPERVLVIIKPIQIPNLTENMILMKYNRAPVGLMEQGNAGRKETKTRKGRSFITEASTA